MSINITDELHAATTKGKIASAKEVYLDGDKENLQQVGEKTHQLEEAIKDISASGGASTANAVSFDNSASGMIAVTVQGAVDELSAKDTAQDAEIAKKANTTDVNSQMQEEQTRVNAELDKKFDKENIASNIGEETDKVPSSKAINAVLMTKANNEDVIQSFKNVTDELSSIEGNIGILDIPVFSEQEEYEAETLVNYKGTIYKFVNRKNIGSWEVDKVISMNFKDYIDETCSFIALNKINLGEIHTGKYYNSLGTLVDNDNSVYYDSVDLSKYGFKKGDEVYIILKNTDISTRCMCLGDSFSIEKNPDFISNNKAVYVLTNITDKEYILKISYSSLSYIVGAYIKPHEQKYEVVKSIDVTASDSEYNTMIPVYIPANIPFSVLIKSTKGVFKDDVFSFLTARINKLETSRLEISADALNFKNTFCLDKDVFGISIINLKGIASDGKIFIAVIPNVAGYTDKELLDSFGKQNDVSELLCINNTTNGSILDIGDKKEGYYYSSSLSLVENENSFYYEPVKLGPYVKEVCILLENAVASSSRVFAVKKTDNTIIYKVENNPDYTKDKISSYILKCNNKDAELFISHNMSSSIRKVILIEDESIGFNNRIGGNNVSKTHSGEDFNVSLPFNARVGETVEVTATNFSNNKIYDLNVTYDNKKKFNKNVYIKTGCPITFKLQNDVQSLNLTKGEFSDDGVLIGLDCKIKSTSMALYISPDGNDANNGSIQEPKSTINACLKAGASEILVKGGVYSQTIDFMNSIAKTVSIRNITTNEKAVFVSPKAIVATSASLHSGKVYKVENLSLDFSANNKWMYQDGVNDESTIISDEERHPNQRGQKYRCDSTRIELCTSTDVDSAVSEIENYQGYKWYYDVSSKVLYLSCPQEISEENPICYPTGSFILSASKDINIEFVAIDTKYMGFNLSNFGHSKLYDCSAKYVFGGGAFSYNNSIAEFVRCEAARCISGSVGDGFNGHATKTGNAFSKTCVCSLTECWSHDNNDDGYSDHERAETTIMGGLYEYNGKAGITPSYGSHCKCYNVYSRQNYAGFFYTGETESDEGGVHGQMICYNCVSENNRRGGIKAGFAVNGTNKIILINCKAINESIGYKMSGNDMAKLIDCKVSGCDTDKLGQFEIVNLTNLV